jgi:predicted DNA-binding protein (MmcQ/YjbR family)
MIWDELLSYCLAKPGAWPDEPWEGDVVVKVGSKIFAFLGSASGPAASVGLKCGPNRDVANEWLARYPADASVMAYIGRSGWNSLRTGGAIPDDELREAIDASYDAVVSKLPRKDRPGGSSGPTGKPPGGSPGPTGKPPGASSAPTGKPPGA